MTASILLSFFKGIPIYISFLPRVRLYLMDVPVTPLKALINSALSA